MQKGSASAAMGTGGYERREEEMVVRQAGVVAEWSREWEAMTRLRATWAG